MSLHAPISPEALIQLNHQKRNSALSSVIIAILSTLLLCLIFGFLLLPVQLITTPQFTTYNSGKNDEEKIVKPEITHNVQRKPSAPSSSMAKVIASNITSPTALPVLETEVVTPSIEFGNGDDFGQGWGNGFGSGGGSGGGFGNPNKIDGTLSGYLYDFKQTPQGKPIADYSTANRSHFTDRIKRLHRSRYSESALARHYQAKQELFVRYIAIPFSNANEGPKFFNAEKEVKPSGWIAHYHGEIVAPKSGTFRFVGSGDDYLSVTINKKFRMVAAWTDIINTVNVRGANARKHPKEMGPFNIPLNYGDWFTVRKGQKLDIAITLGERPGGKVGFILMLEEKGADYRKTASGRSILPPFTVGPLSSQDIDGLQKFPNWEWETENVPVFYAQ